MARHVPMPTNLELKARFPSVSSAERVARKLTARRVGTLNQVDTYYRISGGRLKVREINQTSVELIFYRRANTTSSRYSDYTIVRCSSAHAVKKLCAALFDVRVVVRKRRILYLYKNARIHIDRVRGLGVYIEFEVVVTKGKQQARRLMATLTEAFGISKQSMIGSSYSDMLARKGKG